MSLFFHITHLQIPIAESQVAGDYPAAQTHTYKPLVNPTSISESNQQHHHHYWSV